MDLNEAIEAIGARVGALVEALAGSFDFMPDVGEVRLTRADIEKQVAGAPTQRAVLFLGVYDEAEVTRLWEEHGVLAALRRRLGAGVRVRLDPCGGLLRAYRDDRPEGPDALAVEVRARLVRGSSEEAAVKAGFPERDLLALDWMLLQSPGEPFRAGRLALPGQRWPGLGLSKEVIAAVLRATRRTGAAGALGTPMHYHLAQIYHRLFAFVDPAAEGRFQALAKALAKAGLDIAAASRAVEEGRVVEAREGGEVVPYRWEPREMVLPISRSLREYVERPAYKEAAARALSAARFEVRAAAPEAVPAQAEASVAAWLEVTEGRSKGRRYALDKAESALGRDEACEVSLLDESASRRHALIARRGEVFFLRDLGSRNGTRVNGEKVEGERRLRSDDEVFLGTTKLRFVDEAERTRDTRPLPPEGGDPAAPPAEPFHVERALGLDALDERPAAASPAEARLRALLSLGRLIASCDSPFTLLNAAASQIREPLGADRAVAVTINDNGFLEITSAAQEPIGPLPSRTLLDRALEGREALLLSADGGGTDVLGRESVMRQGVRAVLATPIVAGRGGVRLGVLYVDRLRSGGRFDEEDLAWLAEVARQIGAALVALSRTTEAREETEAWKRLATRPPARHAAATGGGGGAPGSGGGPVGRAPAFLAALETATRAARSEAAVLLLGETGSGKEVFARVVHERSARAAGPFVPVNCAAMPEGLLEAELFGHEKGAYTGADRRRRGLFELAKGGTVFLDELGEMPAPLQAKLLRVLETREVRRIGSEETVKVDFRLVAATNRDLEREVRERKFREDLFFRLNVFTVKLPPLRERPGDAELLAESFLAGLSRAAGRPGLAFSEAARAAIRRGRWPGNVRELRNAVERAIVLSAGREVGPEAFLAGGQAADATPGPGAEGDAPLSIAEAERRAIVAALKHTGGKKGKAAEVLGIAHPTLNRKLKEYGLNDLSGDD